MKKYKIQRNLNKNRNKITIYRNRIIALLLGGLIIYPLANKLLPTSKKVKANTVVSAQASDSKSSGTATGMSSRKNSNKTNTENSEASNAHKDTDIIPGQNITYGGEKYAISASEVQKIVNGTRIDDKKYVFLTFDDGPSPNTEKVLDILKEKNVHATFFVLGTNLYNNDTAQKLLKRSISEGNAIGNHTYTHNFNTIYPGNSVSVSTFMDEFNKTNTLMKSILGDEFDTKVLRMPGGYNSRQYYKDPNLSSFDSALNSKNIVSIDWNALNGDAEGKNYSADQLLANAIESSKNKNQIVILMHDTYGKEKTVQMLPKLIDYYKQNGYEFKTIKSK